MKSQEQKDFFCIFIRCPVPRRGMADDKIGFPVRQGDCRLFPVRVVNSRSVCGRHPSGSFVQSTMFPQCSPLCGRCRQELLTHFHLLLRKKSRHAAAILRRRTRREIYFRIRMFQTGCLAAFARTDVLLTGFAAPGSAEDIRVDCIFVAVRDDVEVFGIRSGPGIVDQLPGEFGRPYADVE